MDCDTILLNLGLPLGWQLLREAKSLPTRTPNPGRYLHVPIAECLFLAYYFSFRSAGGGETKRLRCGECQCPIEANQRRISIPTADFPQRFLHFHSNCFFTRQANLCFARSRKSGLVELLKEMRFPFRFIEEQHSRCRGKHPAVPFLLEGLPFASEAASDGT